MQCYIQAVAVYLCFIETFVMVVKTVRMGECFLSPLYTEETVQSEVSLI